MGFNPQPPAYKGSVQAISPSYSLNNFIKDPEHAIWAIHD